MKAILALEDGTIFHGQSFGASNEVEGEVVFNTGMTGYQEVLTDPSYKGQIVTMTYPLIGNYGINEKDIESGKIQVEGFIIKELCDYPSNHNSQKSLHEYLKENSIMGIQGIDTRALTRHIRTQGAMKGVISTNELNEKKLIEMANASPGLIGRDLVREVTCQKPYKWNEKQTDRQFHVVAIDCGIKYNILRILSDSGCTVTVVPGNTSAKDIMSYQPDGLFISNGPGDPAAVPYIVNNVKNLIDKLPVFGICLGHQILGQVFGGKIFKLKFGHRGANHPVKDLKTGRIDITSQNHGFCVDLDSLDDPLIEHTHINLNDRTSEGLRHKELPVFSVQYHPEASPGPHDANHLFNHFIELMKITKKVSK